MTELLCHLLGDYVFQSDWMAQNKTRRWVPAIAHALTYTACFLLITRSPLALSVIFLTHLFIDRFRLAKYVAYASSFLSPSSEWNEWAQCARTGYDERKPAWLAFWLLIIVDNTMHISINHLALTYL